MGRKRITLSVELLEDRSYPEPNTGCLLYPGATTKGGYVKIKSRGKTLLAHRVMYRLAVGPIGNASVLHRCDTPACINPVHLWLGTLAENNADRARKGRGFRDFHDGRCREGHVLAESGIYHFRGGRRGPKRVCRLCNLAGDKRRRERRAERLRHAS